jgi:hypothetical protein
MVVYDHILYLSLGELARWLMLKKDSCTNVGWKSGSVTAISSIKRIHTINDGLGAFF